MSCGQIGFNNEITVRVEARQGEPKHWLIDPEQNLIAVHLFGLGSLCCREEDISVGAKIEVEAIPVLYAVASLYIITDADPELSRQSFGFQRALAVDRESPGFLLDGSVAQIGC